MRRREFIKTALAGGAGATLAGWPVGRARAYGTAPDSAIDSLLPAELQVQSVVELFLFGGVSQYESFHCIEEFGDDASNPSQWHLFLRDGTLQAALDACGVSGELLEPFAVDAAGRTVKLGPFAQPLRDRPDILDRARMVINAHELLPHELAVPFSLTGRAPTRVDAAGLGTHVQRYFQERDGTLGALPTSYVLLSTSEIQSELVSQSLAAGRHPGTARPLPLRFDASTGTTALFRREKVAQADKHDALLRAHAATLRKRLDWKGTPLQAAALGDYEFTRTLVESAPSLTSLLDEEYFVPVRADSCGTSATIDATRMGLRLASHLVNQKEHPARYVCVVDGGLQRTSDAGGYDSHANNCAVQAANLTHTLRQLADMINAPGESDPTKLDLNRTLVVLNTEFGRTPGEEGSAGRGHWPFGYPTLYLGGPVRARGIHGNVGPNARAETASTPTQGRMAALLALGIWPFEQESFNIGDVPGNATEAGGAATILRDHFGYEG